MAGERTRWSVRRGVPQRRPVSGFGTCFFPVRHTDFSVHAGPRHMAAFLNGVRCWHFVQQRPPDPTAFLENYRQSSKFMEPDPPAPPPQSPPKPPTPPVHLERRPKTAGERLASFPRISSSAEGHRDLLKERRQELIAESERLQRLLAEGGLNKDAQALKYNPVVSAFAKPPTAISVPISTAGPPAYQTLATSEMPSPPVAVPSSKARSVRSGTGAAMPQLAERPLTAREAVEKVAAAKKEAARLKIEKMIAARAAEQNQKMPTWELHCTADSLPTFKSPGVWKAMTYMEFGHCKDLVPPQLAKIK